MAYQPKNGCNKRPSKQQILVIILQLIILCLHSIFIVPAIIALKSPTLLMLMLVYYITLILAFYYYMRITIDDPTDRLIKDPTAIQQIDTKKLTQCFTCGKVQLGSYHCRRCKRCTEEFDHHCKFVNNCIGKSNYQDFIKLLCFGVVNFILIFIQNLWAYISAKNSGQISTSVENNLWVVITVAIVCGIVAILITILLIFHCYILYIDITTLQYVRETENKQKSKIKSFRNSIIEYEEELQQNIERQKQKKQVLTQRELKEYPQKQLHNPENILDNHP